MKIKVKKIIVSLMLLSLFSSYSVPLVSYAAETPEDQAESISLKDSLNESLDVSINEVQEKKEVLESSKSVEMGNNPESNDSNENVEKKEYIENQNIPDSSRLEEKVSETNKDALDESSSEEKEEKIDEKSLEQILKVRDSQYEGKISG